MFWKIVTGAARAAFHINRTVTALGAATLIVLAVHDIVKARNKKEELRKR